MSGFIKISQLPAATTPLTGTEAVALVQGGATKQASVTDVTTVIATGSTTARSLANRAADIVNVKDFGAVGDGVTNDATALSAAAAAIAGGIAYVPTGTYLFNSPVSVTGSLGWRNTGSFSGTGTFTTTTDFSGFNYSADFTKVRFVEGRGTAASPVADKDAVGVFSKHSNVSGAANAQNPSLVAQAYKWNTTAFTVAQGLFSEAIDKGGNAAGRTDFVEGARFHGIGMGASAYGLVSLAQVGDGVSTPTGRILSGVEGEVIRTAGANAVDPPAWTSSDNLDCMFFATVRYGVKPFAAFMVNPYNEVTTRCGFMVGNSLAAQGVTKPIVDFAAFCTVENNVPHGLYVRNVNYSWASVPNNMPLRALNAAGSAEHNILSYGTDNYAVLGNEASAIRLSQPSVVGAPGASVDISAQLEVSSTTRGFLPPRMTGTQRDAISSPANGLVIYNTTTNKLQVRAAGSWVDLH